MEVESGFDFDFVRPDQPSRCTWSLAPPATTAAAGNSNKAECPHASLHKVKGKISVDILEEVGQTPLVRLNRLPKMYGLECEVLVKCEFLNPGGSLKDRIALRMIEEAEASGKIKPGDTLIEPTSGECCLSCLLLRSPPPPPATNT